MGAAGRRRRDVGSQGLGARGDDGESFVTVADVAAFAVASMPAGAPGSLTAEQYWAILAFDLSANGITLEEPLTPELAATLTIPR